MGKNFPRPDSTGCVRGDTGTMPDRGSKSGLNGSTYGADISPTAKNSKGGITSATQSAAPDERPGCNNKMKGG